MCVCVCEREIESERQSDNNFSELWDGGVMSKLDNTSIFFLAVMSPDLSLLLAPIIFTINLTQMLRRTYTHPRLPVHVDAYDQVQGGEGQRRRQSMPMND